MALFQKDVNPIPSKPASPAQGRPTAPSLLGMPANTHTQNIHDTKSAADKAPVRDASESRLIVGPNIKLKGVEIEDCDTLVVEGYVEASMDSRVIEIAESGVYKGTVEIDTAIIRGCFEGNLTARDRLVVTSTGDVRGTIRYGRLSIEDGGRVHGDLDELGAPAKTKKPAGNDDDKRADAAE